MAFGAVVRFYKLPELPPGLYTDEAWYALDALAIMDGARPVYLSANNGREPLFSYTLTVSISALGRTPFAVRLPAAIFGTLTLLAVYALGSELINRRVGLMSAALTGGSFWALAFSRMGLRAALLPFFSTLMLACAAHAWRTRRLMWMTLAGALFGLCFYTYLSARLIPFAFLAFGLFWYAARRSSVPPLRWLFAFLVPAVLVAAPLALYALREPQVYLGRVEQVSIWNGGDALGKLLHNLASTAGMFVWSGDLNARHNLPGRPVFDPLLGLAFYAGVGLCLWQAIKSRRLVAALLLVWAGTMLLPTVLSDQAPHFLRALGALPGVMMIAAMALDWAWTRNWRWRGWPLGRAAVGLALAGGALLTARDYLDTYARDPRVPLAFQSAARDLAEQANGYLEQPGRTLYLDKRLWDFASVRFLLSPDSNLRIVEPGQAPGPSPMAETMLILSPYDDQRGPLGALPPHSLIRAEFGSPYRNDQDQEAQPLFATYMAQPIPTNSSAPAAVFAPAITLQSAKVTASGLRAQVELVWSTNIRVERNLHTFVHLRDANGMVVSQSDGPLGGPLYPAAQWRSGDRVVEAHALEFPADGWQRPGLKLFVGVYDFASGERLARTDQPGESIELSLPNR